MPANVKVLVVDDNPLVRELLRRALAPLATLAVAASASEALDKFQAEAPDLVVADFKLPGNEGRGFLAALRARPAGARVPLVLLVPRDQVEQIDGSREQAEEVIEKPFFEREATIRIRRIIDKLALEKLAHGGPADRVLRGTLAQMNVVDLLQSLDLGHKTCLLRITRWNETGDLYFVHGQIRHAACGTLSGDEAVYRFLTWTEGSFEIDFTAHVTQQTTTHSTQALLMEGLRLLDEANRDVDVLET
jgi:CheY-like chemotaxis protein